MTPASNKPDLSRIGETAFTEVLSVLFSLPATVRNSSSHSRLSDAPDRITSTIVLAGQLLSGSVHLQLPRPFLAHAVHHLTGLDGTAQDANPLLEDAAGELANMVAGRIAAQLTAHGYPCTLGTPSVSGSAGSLIETESEAERARTDFLCDGHWLSLELQCRYAVP